MAKGMTLGLLLPKIFKADTTMIAAVVADKEDILALKYDKGYVIRRKR